MSQVIIGPWFDDVQASHYLVLISFSTVYIYKWLVSSLINIAIFKWIFIYPWKGQKNKNSKMKLSLMKVIIYKRFFFSEDYSWGFCTEINT